MAQSEGFRLICGVGVILRQLDVFSGYYLNLIYLRHLLRHSEPSRMALKHLPKAMPLRRAGKNKGNGWSAPFVEVTRGDWADAPAPKFTFPSIRTPSAGGDAGQFTLASASFSFVPAGTDGRGI